MNTGWFLSIPAMMFPNQEILVFEGTRLTYAQLQERVNRLANALRSLGLGRGSHIGVLQTNCNQYVEAYYATCKLGGTFVPLNYRADVQELKYVINSAQVEALFVGDRFIDLALSMRPDLPSVKHWIAIEGQRGRMLFFEDLLADAPGDDIEEQMEGNEINVLVTYRSENASLPGVTMLSYRNFSEYIFGTVKRADGSTNGTTLLAAPLSHSAGITAIISSMYSGRRLVLMRHFDPKEWLRLVTHEKVNDAFLAPTGLKRLLNEPDLGKTDLSSLETVSYGVAPMLLTCLAPLKLTTQEATQSYGTTQIPDYAIGKALEKLLGDAGSITAFGLGDTISRVSMLLPRDHRLEGSEEEIEKKLIRLSSIGRLIPNIEVKIIGEERQEVPRGEIGEIIVRTVGPVDGYPRHEDVTSEALPGGWISTRELGWIDEDGYVFLVGRKDGLILGDKQRITPANVEAMLLYPEVSSDVKPPPHSSKRLRENEGGLRLRQTHLGRLQVDDLLRFLNTVYESLDIERLRTNYLLAIESLVPASAYGFHLLDPAISVEPQLAVEMDGDCLVHSDVRALNSLDSLAMHSVWTRNISHGDNSSSVAEWHCLKLPEIVGTDRPVHFVQAPITGTDGRLLGTLSFVRTGTCPPFEYHDLGIIRVITHHMATVLGNALKYAELHERYWLAVSALQLTGSAVIVSDMKGKIRFANFEARKKMGQDSPDPALINLVRSKLRENLMEMESSGKRIVTSSMRLPGRSQLQRENLALRSVQLPSSRRAVVTFLYNLEQAPNFQHLTPLLSKREIEVLELVAKGMHNKEIAESLVVTTSTVKHHLGQIFQKMQVNSRSELLAKALCSVADD